MVDTPPAPKAPTWADDATRLFRLDGQTALVTGGSKGLGEAMARALAGAGARVVITSRHGDEARAVATRIADLSAQGFVMRYAVFSHRHGRLAAEGTGRVVSLDYRSGTKTDLPAELAERLSALQ